jgi:hypothetical protein
MSRRATRCALGVALAALIGCGSDVQIGGAGGSSAPQGGSGGAGLAGQGGSPGGPGGAGMGGRGGEDGAPLWSKQVGASEQAAGWDIAVDSEDNILVVGNFALTADLGGGPLVSAGEIDVFVAKYDAAGNHLWSKGFGGISYDEGHGIAVDGAGNVVVTGYFEGAVDFGSGPLVSAGDHDVFVVKYDAAGNVLWSRRFGSSGKASGSAVAIDGEGNVIVTGSFTDDIDFGGGPIQNAGGFYNLFLAKLDPAGDHLWSKGFASSGGVGLAIDAHGQLLVTGSFSDLVDFGAGPLVGMDEVQSDIFVARFDPAGGPLWSDGFGSASWDTGWDVAVDGRGDVFVSGDVAGPVALGGGQVGGVGTFDALLAKYDAAGNHLWSQSFGDDQVQGLGVAVDGAGNVVAVGRYGDSVDFGGGVLPSAGGRDIFVAKYDGAGKSLWSKRFGSDGQDGAFAAAIDGSGNILVTGHFGGTVDFGAGPMTSAGPQDGFILKLGP